MTQDHGYVQCPICRKGFLIPVTIGSGEDRDVTYRCTDPSCGVRFDKHGYERYSENDQDWIRIQE
jgi:hypothetical protein